MSGYAIGALLGRLFASYLIVLLVLFVASKFKGKLAIQKSAKWYSLLAVGLVFIVGISVTTAQSGAI